MTDRLTAADRSAIDEARKVATLPFAEVRAYTGDDDLAAACAVAFGRAQWHLNDLLRIVERLAASHGPERRRAGRHRRTVLLVYRTRQNRPRRPIKLQAIVQAPPESRPRLEETHKPAVDSATRASNSGPVQPYWPAISRPTAIQYPAPPEPAPEMPVTDPPDMPMFGGMP